MTKKVTFLIVKSLKMFIDFYMGISIEYCSFKLLAQKYVRQVFNKIYRMIVPFFATIHSTASDLS